MNRQEIPLFGKIFQKKTIQNEVTTLIEIAEIDPLLEIEKQRVSEIVSQSLSKIDYFDDATTVSKINFGDTFDNKKGAGLCQELSYFYCLFDPNYKLVRGIIDFSGTEGNKPDYDYHYWCENDNFTVDITGINPVVAKNQFYKENGVKPDSIIRYSSSEATENLLTKDSNWTRFINLVEKIDTKESVKQCFTTLCDNISSLENFSIYFDYGIVEITIKLEKQEKQVFSWKKQS